MKKVLFVATVTSHIKAFHIPYLKMFKEKGYEVHVATDDDAAIQYCDVHHKISIKRNPFKFENLKAIKELKKIINEEKFDIIHCHTPMGSVVARLAAKEARKNGTRVIYTAHGYHFYKGAPLINWLLYYPVEKWLAKYTDTQITINQEDYDFAKKKLKINDLHLIHGVGLDEEKFKRKLSEDEKEKLRNSLGLKKEDFVIIYPAEISKRKRQELLIKVMKKVNNNRIKLILPGKDSLNGKCQKMIADLHLEKNIIFLGFRQDIPQLLQISNMAISTAKQEGLPVNILEAMYTGLPIVATDCRGNRELVDNKVNGILVKENKQLVESLYNSINLIFDNEKIRHEFGKNSQKKIKAYTLNEILPEMGEIYFKKKKVLHILSSNTFSGAENVACTIINNLKENYELYYCCPNGKIQDVLKSKKIRYIPLEKLNYMNLKSICKKLQPDIIHAHDYKASCLASLLKNRNIVSHIHQNNTKMREKNIFSILYKICSRKFYKIIYVSESALEEYYYKKNVINKSVVIANVIDNIEINNKSKEFFVEKNYDLIFLARLVKQKNPERVIKIVFDLAQKIPNIKLAIIGDGEKRKIMENMVSKFNLKNNIDFVGYQKNPYPYLLKSKILIMTSYFEGTPMATLEAQNFGIPIVSTPVDGLKKIVSNGYNGFLYSKDEEIEDIIYKILKDEKLLEKLSENSKAFFADYNNLSEYCNKIKYIYEEMG